MGQLCPNENDSEYLGLILPEYLAKINGNWLFLALIFEKLIEIAKYYDWESIFRGSLYEILGQLYEESAYVPGRKLEKIQPGMDYITEHFTEDFEIERLSAMCGMSHTYFKKIFTAACNMPPKAYITHLRIQYACDLLKSGQYKISDIAETVGYKNVYYFSKVFKAQTGIAPSKYRKTIL